VATGDVTADIVLIQGAAIVSAERMLVELCTQVFESFDPDYLAQRLAHLVDPVLHLAQRSDGAALGFKLAYRRGPALLYSWLGGVIPAARGQGLAERLMQAQHDWASAKGYAEVETRTRASNNAMIIINLKTGFQIAGVEAGDAGHLMVILRKTLKHKPERA
jgi:GNAT superfamily N-acetyltransferase